MANDAHASGFVGGDLADSPYISDFGAFVRVVRLNRFRPHNYLAAFGLRVRRKDDFSRLLSFSTGRRMTFWQAMATAPPPGSAAEDWLPVQGVAPILERGWHLRYCPQCMRSAYHCNLTQMPWIQQCPIHHIPLRTTCPRCDEPVDASGEHDNFLLICPCGHDLVEERLACRGNYHLLPQIQRELWRHLAWATHNRTNMSVIAPDQATDLAPLSWMLRFPGFLQAGPGFETGQPAPHARRLHATTRMSIHDTAAARARLGTLSMSNPGIVEMPGAMLPSFRCAAAELIRNLPHGALTRGELALFMGAGIDVDAVLATPARRRGFVDIAYLPPHRVGDRYFLSFNAVDRVASRAAHLTLKRILGDDYATRLDMGVAEAEVRLALSTVEAILLRAYSEGMRIVLGRYLVGLDKRRELRPRLSIPWVLITTHQRRVASTLVCWFPGKMPDSHPTTAL